MDAAKTRVPAPSVAPDPDTFCEQLYPQLVGIISLHGYPRHRSEDLAQDALIRALERWPVVSDMRNPRAWVIRVALNLANSAFRRAAAERRANRKASVNPSAPDRSPSDDVPDRLLVLDALRSLSRQQRSVIVLRYFVGMDVAETAETLGCSAGSVKTHTSRALEHLRTKVAIVDDLEDEA